MQIYHFSNALGYTLEQLNEMHNASFQGYFVPIMMTPEITADFWRTNQIDALRSVVMHDEAGAFVGMARMGTRGKRGWCGGFGIVPEFRSRGASTLLAEQMVRVARETGLDTLQLEVLTQNVRAIKLYERVGFTTTRRLLGLEIATSALPVGSATLRCEPIAREALLSSLAGGDQPCWGNELSSILAGSSEAIIAIGPDGRINGVVLQRGDDKIRIQALLLQSKLTKEELASLLQQAAGSASSIQVYNEPEESLPLARYRALGFAEFFSQYEMFMKLSG